MIMLEMSWELRISCHYYIISTSCGWPENQLYIFSCTWGTRKFFVCLKCLSRMTDVGQKSFKRIEETTVLFVTLTIKKENRRKHKLWVSFWMWSLNREHEWNWVFFEIRYAWHPIESVFHSMFTLQPTNSTVFEIEPLANKSKELTNY